MIVVLVIASLAKHLGGTPRARILAAVCTAVAAVVLAVTHILSTTTFDLLAWVLVLWLVTRILQGADPRLWIAVGGVAGIGLLNKHLVLFLVISLAIGIVLGRRVDVLRSWWLVAGVALALVIWSPNLVWQATHGWPQLDMARAIADSDGAENRATLVPLQLLLLGPLLLPIWGSGLWWLAWSSEARPLRPLAWTYPVLLVAVFVGAGKSYYVAPVLLVYLAAGCVVVDRWMKTSGRCDGRRRTRGGERSDLGDHHPPPPSGPGCGRLPGRGPERRRPRDDRLATAHRRGRRHRAIAAAGAAADRDPLRVQLRRGGAIDHLGRSVGLPRAYSGHNSYSDWGIPPDDAGPVVLIGYTQRGYVDAHWTGCEEAARVDNRPRGRQRGARGAHVGLRRPRAPWAEMWDDLTDYG